MSPLTGTAAFGLHFLTFSDLTRVAQSETTSASLLPDKQNAHHDIYDVTASI